MFVNVSPSPVVFDETLKVLELSAVAKKVYTYVHISFSILIILYKLYL